MRFLVENVPAQTYFTAFNEEFQKNFTCVSFAEPPKFGRRFLLLSGGVVLQRSLFNAISATQ